MMRPWLGTKFWSGLVDKLGSDSSLTSPRKPRVIALTSIPVAIPVDDRRPDKGVKVFKLRVPPRYRKPVPPEPTVEAVLDEIEQELNTINHYIDSIALPDGPWANRDKR